ncbi:cobalamin-independent methionine synthase II family protein [Capillimicrobium parvum]|uniref:5-methyltetrahydropteroyltriglutamate--homocysteine methyltransferase n=1 Tax=Capillimicrobium parvum TaxID=2884022 RepID=A0A9E6XZI2_9ACTN|nr:cobalamin-independent methionine synthase II family protein [Capillimicrobium parvum]UGS37344.1 5-methyltetrahydropteroyltriglutamate--homocysteine methyltransferase [Capillimicrobium parvum]
MERQTEALTAVHHAEVVGSLLRPDELVAARAEMRAGRLDPADYRAIEDRAVDAALRLQEDCGVDVVTDGEMRRDIFFDFLIKGVTGIVMQPAYTVRFHDHTGEDRMSVQIPFSVAERISALPCPAVEEFRYARERTSKPLKVTLPGPIMMLGLWGDVSRDAYPDPLELVADAGAAIKRWMGELAEAGCTFIQLDMPDLIDVYCDASVRAEYDERGIPSRELIALGTDLAVEFGALELPGVKKAMHLCRGNGTEAWIAEGGYEDFSEHVFRRATGYDVFHLEYDDDRSGGFEPLANLPDDKVAALGLVSTKWTQMEDPAVLVARIEDAARYHPVERLALAPQCGFASASETAEQRRLTPETQEAKLRLVSEVAREVWG